MNRDAVPLADAVESLRRELRHAVDRGAGQEPQLVVDSIELELQVVRTTGGQVGGSGGLWQVLTVGGQVSHQADRAHRVRLSLRPRRAADDTDLLVADEEVDQPR
jgi:hypothetical protein